MFSSSDSEDGIAASVLVAARAQTRNEMFSSSEAEDHCTETCRTGVSGPGLATDVSDAGAKCPVTTATQHERELSPKSARSARWMLYEPGSCSLRLAGRTFDKDYRWLSRALTGAASLTIEIALQKWATLLSHLRQLKDKGAIECVRFCWCVMADETPTKARVRVPTTGGEYEHDSIIAKVMASRVSFSMLIKDISRGTETETGLPRASPDSNGEAPIPEASHDASDEADLAGENLYILHGSLPTTLRPMESQKAGVVRTVLYEQRVPEQETVESLFRDLHRMDSTDLHPSMLSATRAEAASMSRWRSMHLRCGIHRMRTSELHALHQDALTDSFFLNMTLSLRTTGAMTELRRKAAAWIRGRVRIVHGCPPQEVLDWRGCVSSCLRRRVENGLDTQFETVLLHAWDAVFTGDGRKRDCVEHYHVLSCGGIDQECIGAAADAVADILSKIPKLYSRRSWHGQILTTNHIIVLEAMSGLLSQNYGAIVSRAQKMLRPDAI